MMVDGWKYYNHSAVPTCAPHEMPDLAPIESGDIWKIDGSPLLARRTTDFDCGKETKWWYVIKDEPFDIHALKAKRRYEITKGTRNFDVRRLCEPAEYAQALCAVQIEALSAWPQKYRPDVNREMFIRQTELWAEEHIFVYGAFSRADDRLCGYAYLTFEKDVLNFSVLRTIPECERDGVNAAMVYKILQEFEGLTHCRYICDGAKSISHESAFQDYLIKYFGFRRAYCKLHIQYHPKLEKLILFLYRFRKLTREMDHIGIVHKVNGIFAMQEIVEDKEGR